MKKQHQIQTFASEVGNWHLTDLTGPADDVRC